ncbi:MAG: uracil-DNA glycosylase family protein, partial [Gemmatimonadota bacterium]
LRLIDCWLTASVRCAPPDNRPKPAERRSCRPYLEREIDVLLPGLEGIVALGGYAYRHVMRIFRDRGWDVPSPMPDFGHGLEVVLGPPPDVDAAGPDALAADGTVGGDVASFAGDRGRDERPGSLTLLTSYHPSQQNTFTGTLTEEMFDRVWERARELGAQAGR